MLQFFLFHQLLDDLPKTLDGLNELRQEIKDSTTANNGKIKPEHVELLQKIKTQEKAIGERNKQKRKK
ncbi:hypothetical protein DVR12_27450 [Chitinophaga silvatica]|uniref:Uncharacterized protein n=1 Tax=Chitinophaga silvatica TaxID=2282649 RepID=A0A3E1Y1V8_9BACT|nr:hypothetical protein [Chitinophaga silvatica]RFS18651.1 hypothetical protein DVR12_27450 [Chitinophaga silvatica]